MGTDISVYDKKGVCFSYPNNWTLQESSLDKDAETIMVTGPDESFWLLVLYPEGVEPDMAARNILNIMTGEYKELEHAPVKKYFGERVLFGYEINFFYLDLTSTALVLGFEEGERTYIIFWQTTDRMALSENLSNEDVLEAITYSFLDHLPVNELP